ncbi:MAG TPA: AAA family ATPase, partial [Sandaracinaceae bacterium]
MRILAIRGANLASLEGEFELDLAEGPLARAGVFAICGPTGAGKSTLLDAMCLALFDAVPRLVGASRVRIGREDEDEAERLTASDSRWILRKGVGSGFAEVDFLGVDRRRYRARWELRRAHGRANGKLQSTGMSLVDLDDARTVAGDRKTDVKRAIEEKLGLTFDQFRRSVLLAQNDFAAFLDADAKERAGLLERMTGTEIYGLISIEAHERAVREREELRRLEERASYYTLLSDEERAELEQRAEALGQSAAREQKRMREAESALRWYAQLEGLREEEESARREKERVERQLALAESKRRQVEAYESALPLRPFLEALDRARAELLAREGELALAAEAHAAAEARAETARQAHGEAAAEAERAERALTESAPALAEARVLDGQLARLREELAAAERRRAAREADLATREEKLRSLERTMADARAEADRARAWLEAHPAAGALAERWDRTEARLERLAELAREERAHVDERLAMERALSERRAQRDAHAAVYAEAERARREASTRYEEALAAARAAPSEALTEVRSRCMSRHTALERMLGVAELAERAADDARRLRDEAERAAVEAERAERAAKEAADERARVWARLEEARRTRDRLRSTLDLAGRRAELVDGEPCPLCGATEHPYAHAAPAVERLLAAQDERTSELEAELSSLHQREADQRRAAAMHRDAERKAREEAGKRSADLAEARERYAELARTLATDGAPWPEELPSAARPANAWGPLLANVGGAADGPLLDAAARAALEAARDEAERTLRALDEEERARRACEREAEERREALERARAAAAQASEALSASERECTELARKIEELDARIAAIRERAAAIADELAPELSPLPAWRERLAQDPALLLSEARREVEARREKTAALEAAERRARELAPALEAAREQRDAARHELDDARGAHDALARALQEKQRARDALLGGRDADAHEAALRAA